MFFILSLLPVLTFTERHAFIFLIRIFNESMIADPDKIHDSGRTPSSKFSEKGNLSPFTT
jgi:hypothetical protein